MLNVINKITRSLNIFFCKENKQCYYFPFTYITYITYIKPDFITNVIDILNKFHQNIKFTYEVEHNGQISFLDVLLMRCNGKLETTVFRKETNNDIYLHWRSFARMTWKKGTLWTLIRRAYRVCSNDNLLQEELHYIEACLTECNGYP